MKNKPSAAEGALYVVGGIAFAFVVIKGMIIGFYDSELPMLVIAGLVAVGCLLLASRMTKSRQAD